MNKCKGFKKGSDGKCIHYIGDKIKVTSCANQCKLGGFKNE